MNFVKFLRTPFLQNTSGRLLLRIQNPVEHLAESSQCASEQNQQTSWALKRALRFVNDDNESSFDELLKEDSLFLHTFPKHPGTITFQQNTFSLKFQRRYDFQIPPINTVNRQ